MNKADIKEYRRLKDAGWEIDKEQSVKFNGGSESDAHAVCKLLACIVCRDAGYRVDTEVVGEHGEADIVAYHPERTNLCIEIETNADRATVMDKKGRYVDSNDGINEIFVLDPLDMSTEAPVVKETIKRELGL